MTNVRAKTRALLENGHKIMEYSGFVSFCKEENIENEADIVLQYLHDTGVLYYKQNYFKGSIILQQDWAIEAVYKVLDKGSGYFEILEDQKGEIKPSGLLVAFIHTLSSLIFLPALVVGSWL